MGSYAFKSRSYNNIVEDHLTISQNIVLGDIRECWYCGKITYLQITKDHFYPKSKGGKLKVYACKECNCLKGDKTPIEWIEFLLDRLNKCDHNKGCKWGPYNKSACDDNCERKQKWLRIITATETLWNKVKSSSGIIVPKKKIRKTLFEKNLFKYKKDII